MLKMYLLTAFRSLLRNKSYSILNIAGLSLGITCSILLFLVIQFELSYDTFHSKADRIYRVTMAYPNSEKASVEPSIYFPVGDVLQQNNPGIEAHAEVFVEEDPQFTIMRPNGDDAKYYLEDVRIAFVEPAFFTIFDFVPADENLLQGLAEPNTVVLTQGIASKYFPGEDAVGKFLKLNNRLTAKVIAVIPDMPPNTDFPFGAFFSYASLEKYSTFDVTSWNFSFSYQNLYITLPENTDPAELEKQLNATVKPHMPERKAKDTNFVLQPLSDLHYNDELFNLGGRNVTMKYIFGMTLVGIFLLLTACINFINLATAQAIKRAKEVGVRKVMGSNQWQIMLQFFGETLCITILATFVSVILAELALPYLNDLLELKLSFNIFQNPQILLFLVLEVLVVTIFSGLYPALVLARFEPIAALKSKMAVQQVAGFSMRSVLVVVQFAICQVLIICTLIVTEQMQYVFNKPLGFDKNGIIQIGLPREEAKKLMPYRHEMLQNPAVLNVSFATAPPSSDLTMGTGFFYDYSSERIDVNANTKYVDEHYFETFDLKLIAGRTLSKSDTTIEFVINETMRRKLGLENPQEALGKKISFNSREYYPIVGVIEDFHQNSLRDAVDPALLTSYHNHYFYATAKIDLNNIEQATRHLEHVWNKAYPDDVFNYTFLDETIANFYREETRQKVLFRTFAFIAILIGCIGLYGLVAFMAAQRTKEVGIRKVMGASIFDITLLFSKDFVKLVLIAFVIAAPVAYYLMHEWLQSFLYRISIGYWPFLLAGAATLLVALVTMGSQAIRAATANPVYSLKAE
jgi:putative ABC transport system permease protein